MQGSWISDWRTVPGLLVVTVIGLLSLAVVGLSYPPLQAQDEEEEQYMEEMGEGGGMMGEGGEMGGGGGGGAAPAVSQEAIEEALKLVQELVASGVEVPKEAVTLKEMPIRNLRSIGVRNWDGRAVEFLRFEVHDPRPTEDRDLVVEIPASYLDRKMYYPGWYQVFTVWEARQGSSGDEIPEELRAIEAGLRAGSTMLKQRYGRTDIAKRVEQAQQQNSGLLNEEALAIQRGAAAGSLLAIQKQKQLQ